MACCAIMVYTRYCTNTVAMNGITTKQKFSSNLNCNGNNQWSQKHIYIIPRIGLPSKFLLAQPIEFCNSSICLYRIKKINLLKSTCLTGSFTCPGPSGSGKWRVLPSYHSHETCDKFIITSQKKRDKRKLQANIYIYVYICSLCHIYCSWETKLYLIAYC